jgi:hypothetical protein
MTSDSREESQGKRLADPAKPLSVDEDRDYKAVRAAVYFLRAWRKKTSYRAVARVFQATDDGLRAEVIRAYLRRLTALESIVNQGRTQAGRTRDAVPDALLSTTGRNDDSVTGRETRGSSITGNINKNDGSPTLKEPTEGERDVLDICLAWSRGESPPMPEHLVHLYRTMRERLDLPRRPRA